MKIEVLYPEICNLYGELANIRALKESINDAEIISTRLGEKPAFINQDIDMVYMGSATESGQKLATDSLKPYCQEFRFAIEKGQNILITGNALEILGQEIQENDQTITKGLGILDTVARRFDNQRFNSLYVGEFQPESADIIKVVGYKSVFGFSYGNSNIKPFCRTLVGYGNNQGTLNEGFQINNLIATYVIGPLFILNPILMKWFMNQRLGISKLEPAFYEAALDAYNTRLDEYLNKVKGWKY